MHDTLKILAADDDPTMGVLLQAVFAPPHQLCWVADGLAALIARDIVGARLCGGTLRWWRDDDDALPPWHTDTYYTRARIWNRGELADELRGYASCDDGRAALTRSRFEHGVSFGGDSNQWLVYGLVAGGGAICACLWGS